MRKEFRNFCIRVITPQLRVNAVDHLAKLGENVHVKSLDCTGVLTYLPDMSRWEVLPTNDMYVRGRNMLSPVEFIGRFKVYKSKLIKSITETITNVKVNDVWTDGVAHAFTVVFIAEDFIFTVYDRGKVGQCILENGIPDSWRLVERDGEPVAHYHIPTEDDIKNNAICRACNKQNEGWDSYEYTVRGRDSIGRYIVERVGLPGVLETKRYCEVLGE